MVSYVFDFFKQDVISLRRQLVQEWSDLSRSEQRRFLLAICIACSLGLLLLFISLFALIYFFFPQQLFVSFITFFKSLPSFVVSEDGFAAFFGFAVFAFGISFMLSIIARVARL